MFTDMSQPFKPHATPGNIGQIAICDHVGSSIRFIDPMSLKSAEITADQYWRNPFHTICPQKQLIECVVF